MDLFLINGQENLSLPEMIDWDMKLCDTEMGLNEEVGISNYLGVGYDLSSLDIEEEPNLFNSQSYSANSNSSFELDLLGEGASALMVDPSSVVPFVSSHRRFNNQVKVENIEEEDTSKEDTADLDYEPIETGVPLEDEEEVKVTVKEEEVSVEEVTVSTSQKTQEFVTLPIEFVNISQVESNIVEAIPAPKKVSSSKRQVTPSVEADPIKSFPKPAYSYSCLIAMALKNSLTGSLPVSEIYSFMCHHFPYFKTAPSGWKNSVRHNLSLNKCFEKIEKPPGTGAGGSQRKGCLWAMNPAKITKMDDEVAKWSKKDPLAIKKAMVYPDNLELLERGELKDLTAFGSEEADEDVEETKEDEEEIEDDFVTEVEDDRISPIDDDSEDEISKIPPSLRAFEPKFARLSQQRTVRAERLSKKSIGISGMDFEVNNEVYGELNMTDTRLLLGLDDSTPIYAVDPMDENLLIELPLVKRPRVQANCIYQPVLNVKRHNIANLRSIKIQSP